MRYKAKSNVIFGGVSLSDYNAFSFWCDIHERPQRHVDVVSIPGRNGDLIFDNGRYLNVARRYMVRVQGTDNYHNLLAALMKRTGYQRLEDEYDPEHFMTARISEQPVAEKWTGEAAAFTLTFDRKPQRFLKAGEKAITVSNNAKIWNPTLYEARPLVRASSTGTIAMGGETIQINSVSGYVDIDCELQDAYKEGTNCNNNIQLQSGDFFKLLPGNNGVTLTGISSVIVTPRWWTI